MPEKKIGAMGFLTISPGKLGIFSKREEVKTNIKDIKSTLYPLLCKIPLEYNEAQMDQRRGLTGHGARAIRRATIPYANNREEAIQHDQRA